MKVINTHGAQVVDTWAFRADDLTEFMSMEHSRPYHMKLRPEVGDTLVSNQRRPIMTLVEDTSGGVHDTLMAACDNPRYGLLGCTEYHDNCTDNLTAGMKELGLKEPETPSPLNLFMHIPWTEEGGLAWEVPVSTPRELRGAAGRDGFGGRVLGVSPRHPADQRRDASTHGSAFSNPRQRVNPCRKAENGNEPTA